MRKEMFPQVFIFFLFLTGTSTAIFLPGNGMFQIRTLCVYFQERQFIPGQQLFRDVGAQNMCVKCDASRFQTTAMACTGQSEVPSNTTQTQAFCLITNCLQQVPQTRVAGGGGGMGSGISKPGFGRRRRNANSDTLPCTSTLIQDSVENVKVTSEEPSA